MKKSPMWMWCVNVAGVVLNVLAIAVHSGRGNWGWVAIAGVGLLINLNGTRKVHYENESRD